jgi:hypothetical protein
MNCFRGFLKHTVTNAFIASCRPAGGIKARCHVPDDTTAKLVTRNAAYLGEQSGAIGTNIDVRVGAVERHCLIRIQHQRPLACPDVDKVERAGSP